MTAFDGFCDNLGALPQALYPPALQFVHDYAWNEANRKPRVEVQLQDAQTLRYSFLTNHGNAVMRDAMLPLVQALCEQVDWLKDYFIAHLDVARLRPGGALKTHIDRRYIHSVGERILIPLTESPECSYWGVGSNGFDFHPFGPVEYLEQVKFIAPPSYLTLGHAYRLNNRIPHKVENNGADYRVNLVVDLLPPGCTRDPETLASWFPLTYYERYLVWPRPAARAALASNA